MSKRQLPKIKWVSFEGPKGEVQAIGAEATIGGKPRRNAVVFWTEPTSADKKAAAKELEDWVEREYGRWLKERQAWVDSLG